MRSRRDSGAGEVFFIDVDQEYKSLLSCGGDSMAQTVDQAGAKGALEVDDDDGRLGEHRCWGREEESSGMKRG
jgi:hypothetical protein